MNYSFAALEKQNLGTVLVYISFLGGKTDEEFSDYFLNSGARDFYF